MYEYFKYFLLGTITLMGLYMAIAPKSSTKKEDRDDDYKVAKTKKNGIVLSIAGACAIVIILIIDTVLIK